MEILAEIAFENLTHGALASLFNEGAYAVIISCRELIESLWRALILNPNEPLPWHSSLVDVARNHRGGAGISAVTGDAFHFKPGRHAYIARKIELTRCTGGQEIDCRPPVFYHGQSSVSPDKDAMNLCWEAGDRIMNALTPVNRAPVDFAVAVQRIKYQENFENNERLFQLVESSLGSWAGLGYRIDRCRETARGPLSPRGLCDAYALLNLIKPLGRPLQSFNDFCRRYDRRAAVNDTATIVEKAHYDSRYFSALCGLRPNIRTEIWAGNRWVELPVGRDSIVVLPGNLAKSRFGIAPVLHRVIHERRPPHDEHVEPESDVTLLIGAK